jgi:hypothetical protein
MESRWSHGWARMRRFMRRRPHVHPQILLVPAIEAAVADVADQLRRHAALAVRLRPGEPILSFNPHVATQGTAALPRIGRGLQVPGGRGRG